MVDPVKNYGVQGVSANVELGKGGSRIVSASDKISLYNNAQDTLVTANIANGTSASHAVTNAQKDAISSQKFQSLTTTVNYNSGNVVLGTAGDGANTFIKSVTVEKGAGNWANESSTTNITVGDDSDPDRLFTNFDTSVQVTDETNHTYTSATEVKAYVTAGGASAGTATITIWYSGQDLA